VTKGIEVSFRLPDNRIADAITATCQHCRTKANEMRPYLSRFFDPGLTQRMAEFAKAKHREYYRPQGSRLKAKREH
jgi:hypothetical protein